MGLPEEVARIYASFGTGARLGYSAVVSSAVRDLTGREPISARDALAA